MRLIALYLCVASIAIVGFGHESLLSSSYASQDPGLRADVSFEPKPASASTIKMQEKALASMPDDDGMDKEFASRGFIATLEDPLIRNEKGEVIMDVARYDWIKGAAPSTVNPSLWRHSQILAQHGLFKVADGVYQVRGLDVANMTIVRGNTGWVIIDPLYAVQASKKSLELINEHLGERPVTGVLYTHSHVDHAGGVRGLVTEADAVPILAPDKFVEELFAEFVLAGNSTMRRVSYQFGTGVEVGPGGKVGAGLFTDPTQKATVSLLEPSDYIRHTGESREIDGVQMEFQMVPETEAPAEMNVFLPQHRVLYISEFTGCTMHNIQTPRGALARNALKWAGYITEAMDLYADRSDAMIFGHCWPKFGTAEIQRELRLQRDMYKYIHDQVVRRLNKGQNALEIADELSLPEEVSEAWSTNGYYGTLRHNAKAVFQWYVGWWDGNPAHLNQLPAVEQGKRYVAAIGGAEKVLQVANEAMDQGDYRWSAQLLSDLVFAEPDNRVARAKLADSLEQMGYQTESGIWRNYFLSGARELRGHKASRHPQDDSDMISLMPAEYILELVAARLNPESINDLQLTMNLAVTDRNESFQVNLRNAVLVHRTGQQSEQPDVAIEASKRQLMALFLEKVSLDTLQEQGMVVAGDVQALQRLQRGMEIPPQDFNLVVP